MENDSILSQIMSEVTGIDEDERMRSGGQSGGLCRKKEETKGRSASRVIVMGGSGHTDIAVKGRRCVY